MASNESEESIGQRIAAIDQLAARLGSIVASTDLHHSDDFYASNEQLAALEGALQTCPGYSAEQTAILRQQADQMARSLAHLYRSDGYGDAIPEHVKAELERGVGSRIFVAGTDTFLAIRRALTDSVNLGEADILERQWVTDPKAVWGGEMIRQGHIIVLRNLSEYSWPTEENGAAPVSDSVDYAHDPLAPNDGSRSVDAERYGLRAVTEEMVHLFIDPSLPIAVQELVAKAITADLLLYTGNDHALDANLQRCLDYRDRIEAEHGATYHGVARLGFDNLSFGPNSRTRLIERIERDAEFKALLGEGYLDLFQRPGHDSSGYGTEALD